MSAKISPVGVSDFSAWPKLKYVAKIRGGAGFPPEEQGQTGNELPFYKVNALESSTKNGVLSAPGDTVSSITAERLGAHIFNPGTTVFAKVGAALLLNRFRQINCPACLDNNMMGLEPDESRVLPRYLMYALCTKDLSFVANPGAVPSVNASQIADERIYCPSIVQQTRIANFLDEQTARIDALIAEKERLRVLVEEQFKARLGTAVVEGLHRQRRLVPAIKKGFESVREDWALIPIKHIATVGGGMTPSKEREEFWGGAVPWVSPKDMKRFVLHDSEDHITDEAVSSTSLRVHPVDSVLIVVRGMILAHTFPVAMNAVPVTINQDMKALRANSRMSAEYLAWMLRGLAPLMLSLTEESAHGTKALRTEQWGNQAVPVPHEEEQAQLVAQFRNWEREAMELSTHLDEHILLLREYRSSLISAAVTGQLDIDNFGREVA